MKSVILIFSSLLVAIPISVQSDVNKGKQLYEADPSQCISCHKSSAQFSKAKNLTELEAEVRKWDVKTKTNWYDDEIHDVTEYLNQTYYHF